MVSRVTTRSQTRQLPPRFSEAFHTAKSFVYIAESLLKVKSSNLPLGKLIVHPDADGSDLCVADGI